MKTWTLAKFGTPEKAFELREANIPVPRPHEVCIEAEAFGINFADIMARQGLYQDCPPLPAVIGYEVVGRIHAVGAQVQGFKVGQRVTGLTRFGGYAQYAVTDARATVHIPDDMPVGVAAALATQYATAYFCAEEMVRLHPGDHVLVQAAAGGVGTALVQLAKRRGCIVYGTAGSESKLEYLRKQGVDFPINYSTQDFEKVIRGHVGDRGLDVVFDSIGGTPVKKARRLLGAGGRIVCYGAAEMTGSGMNIFKKIQVAAGFGFGSPISMLMTSKAFIGVNMLRIADHRPETIQRVLKEVTALVTSGVLTPVVGREFSYNELAEAHKYVETRQSVGKVVVKWGE